MRPRVRLGALVALAGCGLWLVVRGAMESTASLLSGFAVALPAAYLLARALVVGWRAPRPASIALVHAALAAAIGVATWRCLQIPRVQIEITLAEFDSARWTDLLRLEFALGRIEQDDPGALGVLSYADLGDASGILALVELARSDERGERAPVRALDELASIVDGPAGPMKLLVVQRLGAIRRPDVRVLGLLARAEFLAFREQSTSTEWRCSRAATAAIRRRLCQGAFESVYESQCWMIDDRTYPSARLIPAPIWPRGYQPLTSPQPWGTVNRHFPSEGSLRRGRFMGDPCTWFEHLHHLLYLGEDGRFHLPGEGRPVDYLSMTLHGEDR
ncbi:MAG: hypothetical protein HY720_24090 [Planctomycetes bacterium]|nr:hypothetical protein [Planctomycetota bacterium]